VDGGVIEELNLEVRIKNAELERLGYQVNSTVRCAVEKSGRSISG
jgi:hypothetical protein